jgi:hypothetical protein
MTPCVALLLTWKGVRYMEGALVFRPDSRDGDHFLALVAKLEGEFQSSFDALLQIAAMDQSRINSLRLDCKISLAAELLYGPLPGAGPYTNL